MSLCPVVLSNQRVLNRLRTSLTACNSADECTVYPELTCDSGIDSTDSFNESAEFLDFGIHSR